MTSKKLSKIVVNALEELKGQAIVCISVQKLTDITDYMVIVTGTSTTHIKALADEVVKDAKESGAKVIGVALNRIPARSIGYYTGNPYYSAYYTNEDEELSSTGRQERKPLFNFWPFNSGSNSRSRKESKRVFDEIDVIESETDGYGWRD